MGWGSYTSADWKKLRESRKMDDNSSAQMIFKRISMDPRFDPRYIGIREARDSEDHPNCTPIILGFDVTGSMGYLAKQIANESLHETMMKLFATKPVSDPQIMFAAIGDCGDSAPLQVTQFESDIRIAEQLLDLWLEGRGGDGPEDYQLIWYFAARHTSIDSFEKRGQKGFIFTIGDADCHENLEGSRIKKIFNEIAPDRTSKKLAQMASEKYELFHISLDSAALPKLREAIPGRVMSISTTSLDMLPELIISTMLLCKGQRMDSVLDNWTAEVRPVLKKALSQLTIKNDSGISF